MLAISCYCSGMTNTLPSDLGPEVPLDQLLEEARGHGAEHGRSQASWFTFGYESEARRLLQLDADGDPLLDEYGPPTAFGGEKRVRDLIEDDLGLDPDSVTEDEEIALVGAYEAAYHDAYWDDVLSRAQQFVDECRAEMA